MDRLPCGSGASLIPALDELGFERIFHRVGSIHAAQSIFERD
jgi:hypothetical protein